METMSSSVSSTAGSTAAATANQESSQREQPPVKMDKDPLWRHATRLARTKERGGNTRIKCNFCNSEFTGSYSRVKAHLLQIKGVGVAICPKVTSDIFVDLQKEVREAEERNARPEVPLPPSGQATGTSWGGTSIGSMMIGSKRKKADLDNPVQRAFNLEVRGQVDAEVARAFYSGGLPFHFARNPHFIQAFTLAASGNIPGYIPPTYNALRTTLLQKEKAHIERLLEPIKGTWKEKGVTIVSDGWTDVQRRPLINFMAITEGSPMFLKAVNCEGELKDKFFIANLIKEVIMEVGPQNVVQVITDNAPVCKAAGLIIEGQFPHIFWTPCVVHTLNLALKNICAAKNTEANEVTYNQCHWITEVADTALVMKNFILNHNMRLSIYNQFATLKLLSVAETRFASVIIMLKRFKLMKRALESMVLCDEWGTYREDDPGKAQFIRSTLLDESWWDQVDYILQLTAPIYEMIRFADTDRPSLHLIYDMWDDMIEKVKSAIYKKEGKEPTDYSSFYDVVHTILVDRWNKSSSPLHCLAHSLNPRYYSDEWLSAAPDRTPPHQDIELSEERNKCLRRYFTNSEARTAINIEFARFSGKLDVFSQPDSIEERGTMEPKMWWLVRGSSAPNVQKIALKLLGQPCSSSCCERNWSTYNFIHSIRRNKIQPQRAEDLVFVHTNLRLLSRKNEHYTKGETKLWDVGGDMFESFDGAEELEIANLSLDEPEMESMIFQA